MKTLLRNIVLDGKLSDILVEDNKIGLICGAGDCEVSDEVSIVDCGKKVAMPGFVNMHTHAAMTLMRGMCEDAVFADWINTIWNIEKRVDEEYVYWGTKVAALEMLRTGTTTFNDQYWFCDTGMRAAVEMGIRPVVAYDIMDQYDKERAAREREECVAQYEKAKSWGNDAIFEVAFHAIYSVSEEMMIWASEFAKKHDLTLHIHLSETQKEVEDCKRLHMGMSPVEYAESLGLLDQRTIAAHTLWLSENDVRILGEHKVSCVHNINSNTKLVSGYKFLYNELRDAGANVCIGTDGCASSNNLDMLEAMKTSALIQKAWREDPKAMPLNELVDMATVNGAKALRLNTGKLEVGALADILMIDTNSTFFLSPGSFIANLVYSAHSDCISDVMVGGKFVMKDRVIKGEQEILNEAKKLIINN